MSYADDPIVIVGAGIAGLATALRLAPMPVTLIAAASLGGECATQLAQGGIAAALGQMDSPSDHAADTIVAAAGLADETVATTVAEAAEVAIDWLVETGVRFDRDDDGRPSLGLEAAHSHARILHAGGDRTGREILRALVAAVRAAPSITLIEHTTVDALTQDHNGIVNGVLLGRKAETAICPARAVVLATGGIGGLFAYTTNPLTSLGAGLALGARAGAVLRDLEFIQFHPTAIDIGRDPMPLATEALRGAGARLVNLMGDDLMADIAGGALAPRDVVAAVLFARFADGERAFLELPRQLALDLPRRFPGVSALCAEAGIDLSQRRIPVRPAAHYHMGGLKVDRRGRTNVEGLWACGEVASSGLHGANRLASNSLLEALVSAESIARDLKAMSRPRLVGPAKRLSEAAWSGKRLPASRPAPWLRALMDRHLGVIRTGEGLTEMVRTLAPIAFGDASHGSPHDLELTALLIALGALSRRESRGAHRRADYPVASDAPRSQELTLDMARAQALEIASNEAAPRRLAHR